MSKDYQRSTSIKELIMENVSHWKRIIICMLIFGLLLGGAKAYSNRSQQNGSGSEVVSADGKTLDDLKDELKISKNHIQQIQSDMKSMNDYLNNSYKIKANALEMESSVMTIYMNSVLDNQDTDNSSNGVAATLFSAYDSILNEKELLEKINTELKLNSDNKYIRELFYTTRQADSFVYKVGCIGLDEEQRTQVLQIIFEYMQSYTETFSQKISEHTIEKVDEYISNYADFDLQEEQSKRMSQYDNLEASLKDEQDAYDSLTATIVSADHSESSLKIGIKYAILGAILGMMIMVFVITLTYLCSGKVHSKKEVEDALDIIALGEINTKGECWKSIVANLNAYAASSKQIGLIGTINVQEMERIRTELQNGLKDKNILLCGNVNTDPTALEKTKQCEAIIITEKINHSIFTEVIEEKRKMDSVNKSVIGFLC